MRGRQSASKYYRLASYVASERPILRARLVVLKSVGLTEGHTMEFMLAKAADTFLKVIRPLNAFFVAGFKERETTCLVFAQKRLNRLQVTV
jgi:hypothetical protein